MDTTKPEQQGGHHIVELIAAAALFRSIADSVSTRTDQSSIPCVMPKYRG
jgi:hypothetical protein